MNSYLPTSFKVLALVFVISICGCSPKNKGEIFLQKGDQYYIRNNSANDLIIFNVQFESITGILFTEQFRLLPGEIEKLSSNLEFISYKFTGAIRIKSKQIKIE